MITETVLAAGEDQQKAAPLGLFVLLLLGVACYFLFKSMSRHLKRVREDFPVTRPAGPRRPPTTGDASAMTPRRLEATAPRPADPTAPPTDDGGRDAGPHAPR